MFKRGFIPDSMTNNTATPGVTPPTFNMQFGSQNGYSSFTPNYQFPYTFSSSTPPMYSWANTNSSEVMKFTGSSNPQPLDTTLFHQNNFGSIPKRKMELDADLPQPPKMRITEEKVSASLRDMHISNNFEIHNYCLGNSISNIDEPECIAMKNTVSTNEVEGESQTTLIMCEELRKLKNFDSIIPQPYLNVERPKNAVALWKPQSIIEFVRSLRNLEEPKSSVVITEITDEEEVFQNEVVMESDECIADEIDEMEL
ncbi:uncharacterized protein LOC126894313 [Daktulosphaira vitifoliae]|uniref:uncharacterized protein LOC126894313 n=1 Tax=Daktulosphaira vitifoliae TaxID=58002 RepID=UPI0021AA152D|nr:uncharacterized protein LOC126894313 [Daktulosphaira vitifoliae]XP_050521200.1 uncharacterized protein LOC126894313 [Daktulosphaira vitifoliae]XP_050521209.1 uncharacterized protein LOC126894313 [Daktulosphaira vitifoliae]XP_050521217.1 uncharacterized protein LOC126894313 [Daktulosphaira vitifoliae]